MKIHLEPEDIQEIATAVVDLLTPLLSNGRGDNVIFDKRSLSGYLCVSISTIDKLVSNKQIPYIKIQKGQAGGVRFSKKAIDKWLERQSIPDVNPLFKEKIK